MSRANQRPTVKKDKTMSYDFNANEIFEMAEQLERNGAAFYKSASDKATDPSAKNFLIGLADMEAQHEKIFAQLKNELGVKEKQATVFDPDDEAGQYLYALADTRVFFEKEIDLTSMKEILKSALTAEKDSIVFYLGMKELVPEKHGKDKIDQIIKEEMGHIKMLGHRLTAQET
ncbi:ferritin family protein [Thermodesulfobacteriota bacterium]